MLNCYKTWLVSLGMQDVIFVTYYLLANWFALLTNCRCSHILSFIDCIVINVGFNASAMIEYRDVNYLNQIISRNPKALHTAIAATSKQTELIAIGQ